MVAREAAGMLLMLFGSAMMSLNVASSIVSQREGLPYFLLLGLACCFLGICMVVFSAVKGHLALVQRRDWKWVVAFGTFGMLVYVFLVSAVSVGAPQGSASALSSINIVVASIVGRAFLGESFRGLHLAAVVLSLLGAFLLAEPLVLLGLGPERATGTPWLGYVLAVLSGFCSAGMVICSRMVQDVQPLVLAAGMNLLQGITCLLLATLSDVAIDAPLSALRASPGYAVLMFIGLFCVLLLAIGSVSAGSQRCPAAVSSTIFTSGSMGFGFLAQAALGTATPDAYDLSGAASMFFSVCLITFARWHYAPKDVEGGDGQSTNCDEVGDENEHRRAPAVDAGSVAAVEVAAGVSAQAIGRASA